MWSFEHETTTAAPRETIWSVWKDVADWPQWDDGIEEVTLNGEFAVGATGKLKPSGGPRFPFEVTEIKDGHAFTDVTKLPLARLTFAHELRDGDQQGETTIFQRISIEGPLTFLWSRVIGKDLKKDVPGTMRSLAEYAEAK